MQNNPAIIDLEQLRALWADLGDIPVNDAGEIETPFLDFQAGTARETIWHWFERRNPAFSVARALGLPPVIECAHLQASDFDACGTVIVKTGRASNFKVDRRASGSFIVYGRTEFAGGSKLVRSIDAVRRLLVTR